MTINGINGQSYGSKTFMMDIGADSTSKNLQSQIANAQKQMQELASNKEMSPEDKMNKRKEIQEQINELQNQLRQHQIEQRKENIQRSTSSMEDMLGGSRQNSQPSVGGSGMSSGSMQAILSADSAMTQVKAQGSARSQMKGKAEVLKAEIKQDGARGGNIEKKQKQLAEIEAKAQKLETTQMNAIADVNKKLSEATKEDSAVSQKEKEAFMKSDNTDKTNNTKDVNHADADRANISLTEEVIVNKSEPVGNNVDVKL
jgi:DNA repair exonuclease SbcCD ATPase subunit